MQGKGAFLDDVQCVIGISGDTGYAVLNIDFKDAIVFGHILDTLLV